ncbi:hypothetical protein ABW636_04815 [Aquimarina sp. 2201CG1-2-11]|uniref:hypothetical protein n=1 Tax=Aquimarina discodermiae TaxID=3231043 RepID=UPI0034623927
MSKKTTLKKFEPHWVIQRVPEMVYEIVISKEDILKAVITPGVTIGVSGYCFAINKNSISLCNIKDKSINSTLTYEFAALKRLDGTHSSVITVKNSILPPYTKNGLGNLLMDAFILMVQNTKIDHILLSSANPDTDNVFWLEYGLKRGQLTNVSAIALQPDDRKILQLVKE